MTSNLSKIELNILVKMYINKILKIRQWDNKNQRLSSC